ncbi:MAG: PKD domain-containing protein [Flavobacteriales bacterium]
MGQSYTISNDTVYTCSGDFYDSGGNSNTYSNNENYVFTICPSNSANIQLDFTSFDVEDNYDVLCVYDGMSTSAPSLGCYDNGTPLSGLVEATSSNSSGCLTFEFTSDGSVTMNGWEAAINCVYPCQDVEAVLSSSNPSPTGPNGEIEVCPGTTVDFNGDANYPQNDSIYHQANSTSTFIWQFGDGTSDTAQNVSHTYNTPGIYRVDLTVIDSNGCSSNNDIDQIVMVAPPPSFDGTTAQQDTICLGDSNTLLGQASPDTLYGSCTPPVADTTALPDGSGVSYTSTVTVDCYSPGQTLNDIDNLENICMTMEHSYLGDLTITLTCPSGQTVTLADPYSGSGGNEFLGEPIDGNTGTPGDGYQYCFNTNPTYGTWSAEAGNYQYSYTDNNGNTYTNKDYLPAGSYTSLDALSGLVGCDLNGDWELSVTDNLSIDDGFIFEWGLTFNDSILPPDLQETVGIDTAYWNSDPSIVSTSADMDTAVVEPPDTGTACYTYTAVDSFGCSFDTTVCFNVSSRPVPIVAQPDTIDCSNSSVTLDASASTSPSGSIDYSWTTSGGNIVSGANTATPTVDAAGNYTLFVSDPVGGCSADTTVAVSIDTASPTVSIAQPDTFYCSTDSVILDGSASTTNSGNKAYSWSSISGTINSGSNTATPEVGSAGDYALTVTDPENGCSSTDTVTVPADQGLPTVNVASIDTITCSQNVVTIDASASSTNSGNADYSWSSAGGNIVNAAGDSSWVDVDVATTYSVVVTDPNNGCSSSSTESVPIDTASPDPQIAPVDTLTCSTDSVMLDGSASTTNSGSISYNWSTGSSNATTTVGAPGPHTLTVTDPENGCSADTSITIPVDTISPNASVAAPDTFTCDIDTVTLDGSPSSSNSGSLSYSWSTGASSPTTSVSTGGPHTLTITDPANGCTDDTSVTVAADTVPPNAIILPPDTIDCSTSSVTLDGSNSSSNSASLAYSWSTGSTNPSISVSNGNSYTLTVTDPDNGCTDDTSVAAPVDTISPTPVIPLPDTITCVTDTVTLDASGSNASSGGLSYSWSTSNGNITSGTNASSIDVNEAGDYELTLTDTGNGCAADTSVPVMIDTTAPTVSIAPPDSIDCSDPTQTLDASASTTSSGSKTFSWSTVNGSLINGANTATPTVGSPASYVVTVTDPMNGCSSTDSVQVPGNSSGVNASFTPDPTQGTVPLTVNFTDQSSGAANYLWLFGDGDSSAVSAPSHTYGSEGSYEVTLIVSDSAGCRDTAIYSFIIVEMPFNLEVPNVYSPNGDEKNDVFLVDAEGVKNFKGRIFNRWGEKLYRWSKLGEGWNGKTSKGRKVPEGTYFYDITVVDNKGKEHQKRGSVTLVR